MVTSKGSELVMVQYYQNGEVERPLREESGDLNRGSSPASNYLCDSEQVVDPELWFLFLVNGKVGFHDLQGFFLFWNALVLCLDIHSVHFWSNLCETESPTISCLPEWVYHIYRGFHETWAVNVIRNVHFTAWVLWCPDPPVAEPTAISDCMLVTPVIAAYISPSWWNAPANSFQPWADHTLRFRNSVSPWGLVSVVIYQSGLRLRFDLLFMNI